MDLSLGLGLSRQLYVYNDGRLVRNCPITIDVRGDSISVQLLSSLNRKFYKNQPVPIQVRTQALFLPQRREIVPIKCGLCCKD